MVSYAYTVRPSPEYMSRVYVCSVWLVDHFDTILQERAQNAKSRTAFIALYAGFLAKKSFVYLAFEYKPLTVPGEILIIGKYYTI